MSVRITNPKLEAFLAALPSADPNALCSPPGLGATFKVKYIKSGLERGVLNVHWSGQGLQFAALKGHGVCPDCAKAGPRTVCTHCICRTCTWEREAEERSGPKVKPEQIAALRERLKTFQFGQPKPVVRLDGD